MITVTKFRSQCWRQWLCVW